MPSQRRFRHACTAVLFCLASPVAWSATSTFPGDVGSGVIPDNTPAGLVIPFTVAGLGHDVKTVALRLQFAHTWAGDIDAVLASPDGRARMTVFSRVGARRSIANGDNSNFDGDYRFTDDSPGDLWGAAAFAPTTDSIITPRDYRASSAGAPSRSDNGGCATSLTGVFGGLTPAQANGLWTLTLRDRASQDIGTVSLAELTITDADPVVFGDGFETPDGLAATAKGNTAASHCINKVVADFTGDGLTDYVLARAVDGDVQWSVRENAGDGTAVAEVDAMVFIHGSTSDFIDSIDYDGDRIADATAWDPVTGTFHVRRSSRSIDPVVSIAFGRDGDDPLQSGDYDGDGRDDLAVFRAPALDQPDGPMDVVIRSTATGAIRSIAAAVGVAGEAFATSGFDMNGDGVADVSVQETNPSAPQEGRFTLFNGRTGALFAQFVLGGNVDFVVPGNHVADPRFDTTVRRSAGGLRYHRTRDALTGAIAATEVQFGITGDTSLGGDYDGDGLTDYAVWRGNATPGQSAFRIRPSTDIGDEWTLPGGMGGTSPDFAVAGSRVH